MSTSNASLEVTQVRAPRVGEILLRLKAVTVAQVEAALARQAEIGQEHPETRPPKVGELLVESKACAVGDIARALGVQSGLPWLEDIDARSIEAELLAKLPITFAKQNELIPLKRIDGAVEVATANPLNLMPLDDLRVLLGQPIRVMVAAPKVVIDTINAAYDRRASTAEGMMEGLQEGGDLDDLAHALDEPVDLLDADDEAPIIRLVNSLLFQAVKERATDIHITPEERDISVRFRVDGIMREVIRPPKKVQASIVSRVKIMAG
ncbi:MAG TPA: ATPase, T2SS/T4P/T4SS family, partial [bacterium]|nr:ATPase, T2SS/T4P/T4SS family [bacterium]